MHPLYTIPYQSHNEFHPVETQLIRRLEVKERSVADTYKSLIENINNPSDKNNS